LYFVEKSQKNDLLVSVLKKENDKSALVFSRTKHGTDRIAKTLKNKGIECEAIHGDKAQNARQRALTNFKSGKTRVIVATDIAARGIDIANLEMVINYDLPDVAETYVHRIGRTGRAGNSGIALTFCTQEEHIMVKNIQKLMGKTLNAVLMSA
jgi:ATP-dependent RNA helicase RhlE